MTSVNHSLRDSAHRKFPTQPCELDFDAIDAKEASDSEMPLAQLESILREPSVTAPLGGATKYEFTRSEEQLNQEQHALDQQAESATPDSEIEIDPALQHLQRSAEALLAFSRSFTSDKRSRENHEKSHTETHAEQPSANDDAKVTFNDTEFCLNGKGVIESVLSFGKQLFLEPNVFMRHYGSLANEMLDIVKGKSELAPEKGDRRFRDPVWQDNIVYRSVLQTYLAWSKELDGLVNDLDFADEGDRQRSQFILNQVVSAVAPSNSPLNPVAVKRAYQTGGLSVIAGLKNFVQDVANNQGMPRQTDSASYQVGKDLAVTPGAVVFRSEVLELIQYRCETDAVHKRPMLIIPPQINKFYIFDLTPKNSIVKHLLQNGQQAFIVSWKNPNKANAKWDLRTYIDHLDQAIEAMCDISQCREIGIMSGCAGGITATALQSWYQGLRDKGEDKPVISSHSMLVTALSAKEHPTLDLFVNKKAVSYSLARSAKYGLMDGRELAHIFAWLRPVDLVWNFWVNNCLLGKEPPTMDVLFWDNDSTRLPAGLHRDFVDIVVNDRYAKPNSFAVDEESVDLSNIKGDFFFLGGEEDYLMPWKNCYRNMALLPNANCDYVLSDGGHIQSVLRPPGIGNISYLTNSEKPEDPETWQAGAQKNSGSWWQYWAAWLAPRSGELKIAPNELGNRRYPVLCESPGTYVLEK